MELSAFITGDVESSDNWADQDDHRISVCADDQYSRPAIQAPSSYNRSADNEIPMNGPFKAFVRALPFEWTDDDLFGWFEQQGVEPTDIEMKIDQATGKSRGMAVIEFDDRETLEGAVGLNGRTVNGRAIGIQVDRPRPGYGDRRPGGYGDRSYERPPMPSLSRDAFGSRALPAAPVIREHREHRDFQSREHRDFQPRERREQNKYGNSSMWSDARSTERRVQPPAPAPATGVYRPRRVERPERPVQEDKRFETGKNFDWGAARTSKAPAAESKPAESKPVYSSEKKSEPVRSNRFAALQED
ncbi:RNA recognition motif [Carpediemonas membranifera]|uniref:RNA recognition motif n=1 Tax=Carpediemonas membranifera TaxID=201153 RepID=A0A8J6AX31_9EUKA|nr:RNA recognition motif [Carpediemonas membranifera]|eukprot:KAG9389434.1 RNA recognition motif [Carpediemonas membranifera]